METPEQEAGIKMGLPVGHTRRVLFHLKNTGEVMVGGTENLF